MNNNENNHFDSSTANFIWFRHNYDNPQPLCSNLMHMNESLNDHLCVASASATTKVFTMRCDKTNHNHFCSYAQPHDINVSIKGNKPNHKPTQRQRPLFQWIATCPRNKFWKLSVCSATQPKQRLSPCFETDRGTTEMLSTNRTRTMTDSMRSDRSNHEARCIYA